MKRPPRWIRWLVDVDPDPERRHPQPVYDPEPFVIIIAADTRKLRQAMQEAAAVGKAFYIPEDWRDEQFWKDWFAADVQDESLIPELER